jgi:beta-glucosidase
VLFGDYNPGGKEPVTWPRSVGQLPIHHYDPPNGRPNIPERGDYKAHWLDEPDAPLFPFGFGLSYTQFAFSALDVPRQVVRDGSLTVRVRLANTGKLAGDEVVQVYLRPLVSSAVTGKRLAAYRRVHLDAGQSTVVEFALPARDLAVFDAQNRWVVMPGKYELWIGNDSAGGMRTEFTVAGARLALQH